MVMVMGTVMISYYAGAGADADADADAKLVNLSWS